MKGKISTSDHADNKIYRTISAGLDAVRLAPTLLQDCRCHFCDESVDADFLFCIPIVAMISSAQ